MDGKTDKNKVIDAQRYTPLTRFMEWLRERRLAPENRIPHYARWVNQFLRYRGMRPRETWQDSLRVFLDELAADPARPEWHVQQAGEAVTLYFGQFRVGEATPVSDKGNTNIAGHAEAIAEMERLMQLRHYAPRTQRSYGGWARRFLEYVDSQGLRLPRADDVTAFLSHLATARKVAASTQNQAFHALLFLGRYVLDMDLSDIANTVRARGGPRLPVVLSPEETRAVLQQLSGTNKLMLELLYGAGLRVSELVALRVKDIDFEAMSVIVRAAKGDKDRATTLPRRLVEPLRAHLARVKQHTRDLAAGAGQVALPDALARKYPQAAREWPWQFVFPSQKLDVDRDGIIRRWHVSPATLQRAMKEAVRRAGIPKPASVHSLRHAYATHLLLQGVDIRQVQELMGHRSVETTMVYTHVMKSMAPDVHSPLDEL